VAEGSAQGFGPLLRQLRDDAGLTQEELAEAASLSARSISDLERGVNATARKETARLLADALGLTGPRRDQFEAIACGRGQATSPGANAGSSPGLGSG
jgi:transcriptional regulator with XRE-family HTH domain